MVPERIRLRENCSCSQATCVSEMLTFLCTWVSFVPAEVAAEDIVEKTCASIGSQRCRKSAVERKVA